MSRKKKSNSRDPQRRSWPKDVKIMMPSKDIRAVVLLLEEVYEEAQDAARRSFPNEYSPLFNFDQGVLVRGINTLKSVHILVDNGHWEMAHSLLRQLLELVANMEFLNSMPDRSTATLQYVKYGLLQKTAEQILTMKYEEKTGRAVDTIRLAQLEAFRSGQSFDSFKANTKNGSLKFVDSWCRRNMKELCEASKNSMRMSQYELLYSPWSEQVHGAPGALINSMMQKPEPGWEQLVMDTDGVRIHEVVGMAVSLFAELRLYLPHIEPLDPSVAYEWLERAKPKNVAVSVQLHSAAPQWELPGTFSV